MLFKKLLPVYNATMERLIRASRFSKSEEAQFGLKVAEFGEKHDVRLAVEAFGIPGATVDPLLSQSRRLPSTFNYHNPEGKRKKEEKLKRTIEIDTTVIFQNGIRRYIFNAVDVLTKFELSYLFKSLSSKSTLEFFKKLESVYPIKGGIHTIQTDMDLNISESLTAT